MIEPRPIDVSAEELDQVIRRLKSGSLQEGDQEIIEAMAETIKFLSSAVREKKISIKRLLRLIFGVKTEKTTTVLHETSTDGSEKSTDSSQESTEEKQKPKGHGRNGADDYPGAQKITVAYESLKHGERCPLCLKGKVYRLLLPTKLVRIRGVAPLQATVYELEKLRCNLCGETFAADPPDTGIKYDESAGSIIAVLKYGNGFPFTRLEKMQASFGMPVPASTQWEIVNAKADSIVPAYEELLRQAAQGTVVHNDDTKMKILDLIIDNEKHRQNGERLRSGLFTTGILSQTKEHTIALYFTGRNHAGENLANLLSLRDIDREPPIQMCDGLSRNDPKPFEVILANCLVHARRNFVDLTEYFPDETLFVIQKLRDVYKHEAKTKTISDEQRLLYHQEKSEPLMIDLKTWLDGQFEQKKVEPNSSLGQAITYMLKRWKSLTLFLKVPGAPLDNNLCEQILKRSIMHRKNSLFFKTKRGAYVGDLFMSIIHTCYLNGVNPFDYLTELEKHSAELGNDPELWMPWNYKETLTK